MEPKLTRLEQRTPTIDTRVGSKAVTERITGWQLVKIRRRISLRDGYTCQICGRVLVDGEVHHKTPLHLGGAEADFNRVYICKACHEAISIEEQKTRDNKY